MVVFTCAHCGDSVQKPKVEKHYETKCRNRFPDLCCMDCLKDFRGDEFKVHMKCVSEAERYGGKGYVAKPGQNKGEKKQNVWIEIVQNVISENSNLPKSLKILLEKVSNQPNTPRKQIKFANFVRSLDRRASDHDIDRAWQLLSSKLELIKSNLPAPKTANGHTNPENNEVEKEENPEDSSLEKSGKKKKDKKTKDSIPPASTSENEEINQTNGELEEKDVSLSSSKKKKKEKKSNGISEILDDTTNEKETNDSINNLSETNTEENGGKKNKKRSKENTSESTNNMLNPEPTIKNKKMKSDTVTENSLENNGAEISESILESKIDSVEEKVLSKKEKKEKKKREKYEAELKEIESENIITDEPEVAKTKGKKRKLNGEVSNGVQESTINIVNEIPDVTPEEPKSKKPKETDKFDWKGIISSVLSSKGKDIPLKKLQKKVLTEYSIQMNIAEIPDRINKKFMKSLKNIENVVIEHDKVSLNCE